jgi:hypothetical protein
VFLLSISFALLSRSVLDVSESVSMDFCMSSTSFWALACTGLKIDEVSFSSQTLMFVGENLSGSDNGFFPLEDMHLEYLCFKFGYDYPFVSSYS